MKSTTWRQVGVGAALACAGAVYVALRSAPEAVPDARPVTTADVAASPASATASITTSTATLAATGTVPASSLAASSGASGPPSGGSAPAPGPRFALPPEQLQYRMRTVLQDQTLLKHQFQMEAWECRDDLCRATVRVPPSAEAGRRQDMGSAQDLLEVMRVEAKAVNAELALRSIVPGKQGIAIEVDLTPAGSEVGRYYTPSEIARIRAETVDQVLRAASQPKKP